jgi:hypothetical protein
MDESEWWEDFGVRVGPFGFGSQGLLRKIRYNRTQASHIVKLRINPNVKKEEIKVRLLKTGLIEIEWPRKSQGEEIPVE